VFAVTGLLLVSALLHAALVMGLWRVEGASAVQPVSMAVSWVQVMPPPSAPVPPTAMPAAPPTPQAPAAPTRSAASETTSRPKLSSADRSSTSASPAVQGVVTERPEHTALSESTIAATSDDFGGLSDGPSTVSSESTSDAEKIRANAEVARLSTSEARAGTEAEPASETRDLSGTASSPPDRVESENAERATVTQRSSDSTAVATPGAFSGRWRYQIHLTDYREGPSVGWLDYVLEIEGTRYRLFTEAQATGLTALLMRGIFRQSSSGRIEPDGFAPERYEERRGDRAPRGFSIDRNTNQINFSGGQSVPQVAGLQDRLSIFTQLSWMVSQGRIKPKDAVIELSVTGSSRIRTLKLRVEPDQILTAPSGSVLNTVSLSTIAEPGDDEGSVDIWFQPGGPLLPIRIRFVDQRGRIIDQFLVTP
jgi:Protein of unknown function (DUF3108)